MTFYFQINGLIPVREFHFIRRKNFWRQVDTHNILAVVVEGKCVFRINKREYLVQEGDVVFIPAGQEYIRQEVGNLPCRFYSIHFDSVVTEIYDIEKIRQKIHITRAQILQDISSYNYISAPPSPDIYLEHMMNLGEQKDTVFSFLGAAYHDVCHTDIITSLILSLCTCHLLAILTRIALNRIFLKDEITSGDMVPEKIKKAVYFIRSHLTEKITLKVLCDYCSISPQHLIRLFQSTYNITPIQYINNIKIAHSKELLRKTPLSIKEIAYEIGIDDPSYFSRLFYKVAGEYPTAFRERVALIEKYDRTGEKDVTMAPLAFPQADKN
jgi:AraC-like DNA-binding protein